MIDRRTMLKATVAGVAGCLWTGPVRATAAAAQWETGPDLPLPLQEIYGTLHRDEIWIAGGLTVEQGNIGISNRSLILDPQTLRWRDGPPLPEPLHHPQLVSANGELYLIGGFRAANGGGWSMSDQMHVLEGDQWRPAPAMPLPLAETHAAFVDGRIHLAGGRTPAGGRNANWQDHADTDIHLVFEPVTGEWSERVRVPVARNSGAATLLNGQLHVIGGRTVDGGNQSDVHQYDAQTDRWSALPALPEPRGGCAAATVGSEIHLFGGEYFEPDGRGGVNAPVLVYDASTAKWRQDDPMPTPRHGLAAVAAGGGIFTIGGATEAGAAGTSSRVEIRSILFSA